MAVIPTWKNGIPNTCGMPFTTLQNMSANGMSFAAYLSKKRTESKHYNVALSHAAKKLVRLINAMESSEQPYSKAA